MELETILKIQEFRILLSLKYFRRKKCLKNAKNAAVFLVMMIATTFVQRVDYQPETLKALATQKETSSLQQEISFTTTQTFPLKAS
jgi:glutaredoxin 2